MTENNLVCVFDWRRDGQDFYRRDHAFIKQANLRLDVSDHLITPEVGPLFGTNTVITLNAFCHSYYYQPSADDIEVAQAMFLRRKIDEYLWSEPEGAGPEQL